MKVRFNTPPAEAAEVHGLSVRYAASKRQLPRLRWYLLVALVTAPLLYFGLRLAASVFWNTSPGIVAIRQTTLKAGASGRFEQRIKEGDEVAAGVRLAVIHPASSADQVAAVEANRKSLASIDESEAQLRVRHARSALGIAENQVALHKRTLTALRQLVQQGAATTGELGQAEAQAAASLGDVIRARTDLDGAMLALDRIRAGSGEGGTSRSAPGQLGADIIAPAEGTILRSLVTNGDWVGLGNEVLILRHRDEPVIRVFINPSDLNEIKVGAQATLRFLDGGTIDATVVKIDSDAARLPPERVSPLAARSMVLVAELKPVEPLPEKYRVSELPLDVRFNRFHW